MLIHDSGSVIMLRHLPATVLAHPSERCSPTRASAALWQVCDKVGTLWAGALGQLRKQVARTFWLIPKLWNVIVIEVLCRLVPAVVAVVTLTYRGRKRSLGTPKDGQSPQNVSHSS
jgi:hypothetical protein